jgi:DNA-binding NtrC family response regulator
MELKGKLLIVDDDRDVLNSLKLFLKYEFEVVETCSNPNRIPSLLERQAFDVVLLDMNFTAGINTGNEGIFWLNEIKKVPDPPVVVPITAYGEVEVAVRAIQEGAADFVVKPWDNDKLTSTLKAALQLKLSKQEIGHLRKKQNQLCRDLLPASSVYLGSSGVMDRVYATIGKVAVTEANILLTGENGTGKEVIAREIHRLSERGGGPFVAVDLGALNENIFEAELFGHVRGAYTDAAEDRMGRFEMAEGGTLFLDEISNVPLYLQTKLLSAIQEKQVTRLGSNETIRIDTRIVAATNRNLIKMVEEDLFREDLLYRINTVEVEIPPLRERGNDILQLANGFLEEFAGKYDKPGLKINSEAQEKLHNYKWPGNVRELKHTIEKAVILSEGDILGAGDFQLEPSKAVWLDEESIINLGELERKAVSLALEKYQGNISLAAEKLGISRPTLYNKMEKYGLR